MRGPLVASIVLSVIALLACATAAHAATITVESTADASPPVTGDGVCTLREAILNANDPTGTDQTGGDCEDPDAGADTIVFAANGTITLVTGLPTITEPLTITGNSPAETRIHGDNTFRPFLCDSTTLRLERITVLNGWSQIGGGALWAIGCQLQIESSAFIGNVVQPRAIGTLTIWGGALLVDSTSSATIAGSAFIDNQVVTLSQPGSLEAFGGAVANAGTTTITSSTFSGNQATSSNIHVGTGTARGGAIYSTGILTLTHATIAGNRSVSGGPSGVVGAGGGIAVTGTAILRATIIALNTTNDSSANAHDDCSGAVTSLGFNIVGNGTGCSGLAGGATGDRSGTKAVPIDPGLGPLGDNGGLTQTRLPLTAGGALDGVGSGCPPPTTDQRGIVRPHAPTGLCDVGAAETRVPAISSIADQTTAEDTPAGPIPFTVNVTDVPGALTVAATSSDPAIVPNNPANLTLGGSNPNRTISVTPAPDATGQVTITITATDALGHAATETFLLTVTPVADAPILQTNTGATVAEGGTVTIVNSALRVVDGDTPAAQLVFTLTAPPTRGALLLNNAPLGAGSTFTQADIDSARLAYRHNGSETTSDSFGFTVSDGATTLPAATFAVAVTPVDEPPTAIDDGYTTPGAVALTVQAPGVLGNDADPEGGALTAQLVTAPANGAVVLQPQGGFIYTPHVGFSGFDQFTYRASDGTNQSNIATVVVGVGNVSTLSIADVTVTEGNAGQTAATFTVSLAPASQAQVTVQFATANGSATAPSDYAAATGTLTFPPGSTSQQVTVQVAGDTLVEGAESFFVRLSGAQNATIVRAEAVGTIIDDDSPTPPVPPAPGDGLPALTIAPAAVTEGSGPTTTVNVPVTLSFGSAQHVTVQFRTVAGTAAGGAACAAGADFVRQEGTLTFAPGQTTATIAIQICNDTIVEQPEAFVVALFNPVNAVIGASIRVMDPAPPASGASVEPSRDKPPRLTEEQRLNQERTNAGSFDDERIEGDVLQVFADRDPPVVIIANRDGPVEVRLIKDARRAIGEIKPGDYLSGDGYKEHEGLFYADELTISHR